MGYIYYPSNCGEADKDSSVTLNLFAPGHLEQFVTSEKNTALFVKNLFLGLDLVQMTEIVWLNNKSKKDNKKVLTIIIDTGSRHQVVSEELGWHCQLTSGIENQQA